MHTGKPLDGGPPSAPQAPEDHEAALRRVEQALEELRAGRMIILVDDEERENEGDLCMAAEKVTPEAVNFMAKYGRGLVCLALTGERAQELELPMMVPDEINSTPFGTAFTVSIEARHGVTTGISAADRARTIQVAIDPAPDLNRHVLGRRVHAVQPTHIHVQVGVVQVLDDQIAHQVPQPLDVEHEAGRRIHLSLHGHLELVVVPVTVRVAARSEDGAVLRIVEGGVAEAVGGGEV